MNVIKAKHFANGSVYALKTEDGYPIETTDTFLPLYTKEAVARGRNTMTDSDYGDRSQRWMIGVSCMSGCPIRCKFCATSQLKRVRYLTADEIVAQVELILSLNPAFDFGNALEHKINYTRMGEPGLNLDEVRRAIEIIDARYPGTHHYVSTIGIQGTDFSWVRDNITLQVSLHSLDETRRNDLIPFAKKMTIAELGQIRTQSNLKTTVNLTLVDHADFDIERLKRHFDPEHFFIKLSPINPNCVSEHNQMGRGVIE